MELVGGSFEELDLAARVRELAAEAFLVLRIADARDDLLVVLAAILARLEDAHPVAADVEDAAEALAHAHRPGEGHGRNLENALDLVEEGQRLLAFTVELVDEGDDRGTSRLITWARYSICITELATEMPRCFSISIQSLVAWRVALRAFTLPAMWIAPAKRRSFSVRVVLPASGCEMIAKVRRRAVSSASWDWELMGVILRYAHDYPALRASAADQAGWSTGAARGPGAT